MEIKITSEELRKRSLFLGLPCYGGQCSAAFAKSLSELSVECARYGIALQMYFLSNESLIQRARNYIADEFVRSNATHLLFIDSDIEFKAADVIAMLALASEESEYDVLCATYPKKSISWEKIVKAVYKGVADQNPNVLENFVGDYVFNPKEGTKTIRLDEPVEVLESGTGFMMIQKRAFKAYAAKYPEKMYRPDHVRSEHFDGTREICAYFDCTIDPKTKRYLSEDYHFCVYVQNAGQKVWLCPWIQLKHIGSYVFGGSLAALASIGANATADPNELGKGEKIAKAAQEMESKT